MDISIIIPTYHRIESLMPLIRGISEQLNNECYEIIFVQDGIDHLKPDEVIQMRRNYSHACHKKNVKGIILRKNVGQQNALLAGYRAAQGMKIISFDDDITVFKGINIIVEALDKFDGVYILEPMHRKGNHKPFYRRVGTWIKEVLFLLFLNKPKGLTLTSYRGFNRDVINYVCDDKRTHVYISARVLQQRISMTNIVMSTGSRHLDTGYNAKKLIQLMWRILTNYSNIPLIRHFATDGRQYEIKEKIQ